MKLILFLSLFLHAAFSLANSWSVPIPDGLNSVWVGENMIQNGMPVQVQSFSSDISSAQIIDFYKSEWSESVGANQPGYIENTVGEWSVISRLENDTNTVIQIKNSDAGGTEGFISVLEPFATPKLSKVMKQFPKMGGTELISATESKDFDKNATTMIFQNNFSVESNIDFYKSRMASSGWTLNHNAIQEKTAVLLFSKKNVQSEIAINKNDSGRTTIFANVVSSS